MAKIYLYPEEVDTYSAKFVERLKEKGYAPEAIQSVLNNHLKNDILIKYSKQWQDERLAEIYHMILEVKGGYWAIQDLILQPHVEFEHYKLKGTMCYEKGNVGDHTAKRELPEEGFKEYLRGKKQFGLAEIERKIYK